MTKLSTSHSATLTITTTGGTTHTYPGLAPEEAREKRDALQNAKAQYHTWWSIAHETRTDNFNPKWITTITVDTA